MYYEFTQSGQPVLKGSTFDTAILICFKNNTIPTSLKQLSAYTSHKMLGVYTNPDGNTTASFQVLKEKNAIHTETASHSALHTRMPGPTTMPSTYRALSTFSPPAVYNAINVNIYRNKLNKLYSLNDATIATIPT